jgi:hypothetical protein
MVISETAQYAFFAWLGLLLSRLFQKDITVFQKLENVIIDSTIILCCYFVSCALPVSETMQIVMMVILILVCIRCIYSVIAAHRMALDFKRFSDLRYARRIIPEASNHPSNPEFQVYDHSFVAKFFNRGGYQTIVQDTQFDYQAYSRDTLSKVLNKNRMRESEMEAAYYQAENDLEKTDA